MRDIIESEVIKMQYQNITLSIPKELLRKIKHIAIEKQTSIQLF